MIHVLSSASMLLIVFILIGGTFAEIELDFNLPKIIPITPISDIQFAINKLETQPEVTSSNNDLAYKVSSDTINGAEGEVIIHLAAKTDEDAAMWYFGSDALITQTATGGLGVGSEGDTNGYLQMVNGEAYIITINTGNLILSSGSQLVFSVTLSNDAESSKIYQRTGVRQGTLVTTIPKESGTNGPNNVVIMEGSQSAPFEYQFAVVDPGWKGGRANRIQALTINILGGQSIAQIPEPPRLHSLFTNNMVLQRRDYVPIYGSATIGSKVTVAFNGQSITTVADSTGAWKATLFPMEASIIPQTLRVTAGTQSDRIVNILVGDVWLAGGQSNMNRQFKNYVALNHNGKDNSNIRIVNIETQLSPKPADDVSTIKAFEQSWQECEAAFLYRFSPTAYFFAAKLEVEYNHNVPIGIILSSKGSTPAEMWTPKAKLASLGSSSSDTDGLLFNGMIHPLRKMTFRGIIFSQGESNAKDPASRYQTVFKGLVDSWRDTFDRPSMPFIFTQLSSYRTPNWDQSGDNAWPFIREAQAAISRMQNTHMVVTYDIGEFLDIHPHDKETLGYRFAAHALALDGIQNFAGTSPEPSDIVVLDDEIIVTFSERVEAREVRMNKNADLPPGTDTEAFVASSSKLTGFSVCGEDNVFVEADAFVSNGSQVVVSSRFVDSPKAVRYCWKTFGLCNLFAADSGLPSVPFRSDTFPQPAIDGKRSGELFLASKQVTDPFHLLGDSMEVSVSKGLSKVEPIVIAGIAAHTVSNTGVRRKRKVFLKTTNWVFQEGSQPYVLMRVLYLDSGTSDILFRYSIDNGQGFYAESDIMLQDTNQWLFADIVVRGMSFAGNFGDYDLRVESRSNFTLGGIFLSGPTLPYRLPRDSLSRTTNRSADPTPVPLSVEVPATPSLPLEPGSLHLPDYEQPSNGYVPVHATRNRLLRKDKSTASHMQLDPLPTQHKHRPVG